MALSSRLLGRSLSLPPSSRLLLSSPSFRSLSLLRRHTQPDSRLLTSRSTSFLPSSSLQQHQRRCIGTRKEPVQLSVPDMEAGFELSEEQKAVLKLVEGGESVFFTGSAGTGKSLLLKHIIKALRFPSSTSSASPLRVAVTASTGAAAVNIGGQTLHSWAGIGLGKQEPEEYWEKWSAYKKSIPMENWRTTDVLIIDEISMIDGPLFDKLEQLARLTRGGDRPFGGMQVIAVGDYFQLPPVGERDHKVKVKFAFEAEGWARTMKTEVDLKQVFRQDDLRFIKILDQMRHGTLDSESISTLKGLSRDITYEDGIDPTELYPVNSQADASNLAHLRNLPRELPLQEFYSMNFAGSRENREPRLSDSVVQRGLAALTAPNVLRLKVGAAVMLIQNDIGHASSGLVNGSVGRVLSFHSPARMADGTDPLPPYFPRFGNRKLFKMRTEAEREEGVEREELEYPLVEFIAKGQKVLRLVVPSVFDVSAADGKILAQRIQIPLILAWAISIHKSQGKTLERVKVDFKRVFEKGQAYVAASRCRRLETLQITNFSERDVRPHPSVVQWHEARKAKNEKGSNKST